MLIANILMLIAEMLMLIERNSEDADADSEDADAERGDALEEVIRKRRSWVEHQVSLDPPTHPAISTSSSS